MDCSPSRRPMSRSPDLVGRVPPHMAATGARGVRAARSRPARHAAKHWIAVTKLSRKTRIHVEASHQSVARCKAEKILCELWLRLGPIGRRFFDVAFSSFAREASPCVCSAMDKGTGRPTRRSHRDRHRAARAAAKCRDGRPDGSWQADKRTARGPSRLETRNAGFLTLR